MYKILQKKFRIAAIVLALCIVCFSACVNLPQEHTIELQLQLNVLQGEYDTLHDELADLQNKNEALQSEFDVLQGNFDAQKSENSDLKATNDYYKNIISVAWGTKDYSETLNAVLYEFPQYFGGLSLFRMFFPEFNPHSYDDHTTIIIKSKAQFDEVFYEEGRTMYAEWAVERAAKDGVVPEAFPFDSTDFSKKTLIVCLFLRGGNGYEYEILRMVRWHQDRDIFRLSIAFYDPVEDRGVGLEVTMYCLVVEVDNVPGLEFDEVDFWTAR